MDVVGFPRVHAVSTLWTLVIVWVASVSPRRLVLTVGLLLALITPATQAAGAVPAAEGSDSAETTFGVQPAGQRGPDGRPSFSWGLTPGARLTDRVAFVNYSRQPLPLSVYATDAFNTEDGGFGLLGTDEKAQDLGSWVDLKGVGQDIVVPPRTGNNPGTVVAQLVVQVPQNAFPGDHSAGVVAVLTTADTDGGAQVRLEQRVVSRVFARVSGEANPSLKVKNLSASYQQSWNPLAPGSVTVTYEVQNNGNINLTASQVVRAVGLVTSAEVVPPDLQVLLPGNSVPVTATFEGVWPQVWMRAQLELTPQDSIGENPITYPNVTATTTFWAIPWVWIAILVMVALVAAIWWRRRRSQRLAAGPVDQREQLVGV